MNLTEAWFLAGCLHSMISPHIKRFQVVGSAGRQEPDPEDLDILVEPKSLNHIDFIKQELVTHGTWTRGGDRQMSVSNFLSRGHLDLFLCHPPAQWYVLLAFRLLPIPIVKELKSSLSPFDISQGTVRQRDHVLKITSIQDLFDLANMDPSIVKEYI